MKLPLATILLLPAAARAAATNAVPTLAPAYGEIPTPFWEQHGLAIIIGGALFAALASLAAWLIFQPKPQPVPSPATVARAALAGLSGHPETGVVLSQISQILRRYLVTAFGLAAGEPTTTEFLALIARHEPMAAELAVPLAAFLRECDERKFSPAAAPAPLGGVHRALKLIALAEQRRAQPRPGAATVATENPPAPR